jgi:intracellular septation protein A
MLQLDGRHLRRSGGLIMKKLLAFAPFLAFFVMDRLFGIQAGLCAGAAASIVALVRQHLAGQRGLRVLEAGTAVLFSTLAAYTFAVADSHLSVGLVRLYVDAGLMLIVLAGIALGRPFVLQHAPEAPLEHANRVAAAWAGAFGVLALADLLLVLRPDWPVWIPIAVSAAALGAAARYTMQAFGKYPHRHEAA